MAKKEVSNFRMIHDPKAPTEYGRPLYLICFSSLQLCLVQGKDVGGHDIKLSECPTEELVRWYLAEQAKAEGRGAAQNHSGLLSFLDPSNPKPTKTTKNKIPSQRPNKITRKTQFSISLRNACLCIFEKMKKTKIEVNDSTMRASVDHATLH